MIFLIGKYIDCDFWFLSEMYSFVLSMNFLIKIDFFFKCFGGFFGDRENVDDCL